VSLLGQKPNGKSEFSFYSFFARSQSFQEWLNDHTTDRTIQILEHPTTDATPIPTPVLKAVAADVRRLVTAQHTVVVMDSGGVQRTQAVCTFLGAGAAPSAVLIETLQSQSEAWVVLLLLALLDPSHNTRSVTAKGRTETDVSPRVLCV
jgi:hypothetical protein